VFGDELGGIITGCDDSGQVAGFVYALGFAATATPNISTTNVVAAPLTADFVCEADGEPSQGSGTCLGVGLHGDGNISIDGNWANQFNNPPPGAAGCPNPSGLQGVGRNIMIIRDNSGGGVVLSVGYSQDFGGYAAEFADKTDPTGNGINPSCKAADGSVGSKILSLSVGSKTSDAVNTTASFNATPNASLTGPTGAIESDCDANSVGFACANSVPPGCTATCVTATGAPETHTFGPGPIYTKAGDCKGQGMNMAVSSGWALSTGSATWPNGQCLFVGSTLMADGVEGPAVLGAVGIAGQLAASAKALGVRAKQAGGDVIVTWHTDSEVGLQAFTIQTKSGRQIGGMIAGKGINGGGASYSVTLKRGDFKSERSLYVVSATADGPLKSDLASF